MDKFLFRYDHENNNDCLTLIFATDLSMAEFEFARRWNDNPPLHEVFEVGEKLK